MKFSLLFFAVLCAVAVAQSPASSDASEEGIFNFKNLGDVVKKGLKKLGKEVGKQVLNKAKDLLTDHLVLQPSKEALSAVQAQPSSEGVFDVAADIVLKRAADLASEYEADHGSSHEGIVSHFGVYHKIYEAENLLSLKYNKSESSDGPSHEGILGNLGNIIIGGFGKAIGGSIGNAIKTAGDVVGSLLYVVPKAISEESIQEEPSHEGILSNIGKLVIKGAGRLAGSLLKGSFPVYKNVLGNIFLARGNFNSYANIQAPANEIISQAKNTIYRNVHADVKICTESAERNFSAVFDQYTQNGQNCVSAGETPGKKVVAKAYDIIVEAVQKVEDVHREIAECFDKENIQDKNGCLGNEIPVQIEEHRKQVLQYGEELANYVQQFTSINNDFDVCLVQHLGEVRREVYHIVEDFHYCVSAQENAQQN